MVKDLQPSSLTDESMESCGRNFRPDWLSIPQTFTKTYKVPSGAHISPLYSSTSSNSQQQPPLTPPDAIKCTEEEIKCSEQFHSTLSQSLVIKSDGYMSPLIVTCTPPLPDLDCDCNECREETSCAECEKWARDVIKKCDKMACVEREMRCQVKEDKCIQPVLCPQPKEPPCPPPPCPPPPTEESKCGCIEEVIEEVVEEVEGPESICCECGEGEESDGCMVVFQVDLEQLVKEVTEYEEAERARMEKEREEAEKKRIEEEAAAKKAREAIYNYDIPELKWEGESSCTLCWGGKGTEPNLPQLETYFDQNSACNNPPQKEENNNEESSKGMSRFTKVFRVKCEGHCKVTRRESCLAPNPPQNSDNIKCECETNKSEKDECEPIYGTKNPCEEGPVGPSPCCPSDVEALLKSKLSCLEPKKAEEILLLLSSVPDKCENSNNCASKDENCCCNAEEDLGTKVQKMLDEKCSCKHCKIEEEPTPPDYLEDADDRDVTVIAEELLNIPCTCNKCNPPPETDENSCDSSPCPPPVICPNVTCGECGCTRGENENCPMCKFAIQMAEEKKWMKECWNIEPNCEEVDEKCKEEFDPDGPVFEFKNGKPVYEGGMSIARANHYLWQQGVCNVNEIELLGFEGQKLKEEEDRAKCTCEEHLKLTKWKGGVGIEEANEYLWKIPPPRT